MPAGSVKGPTGTRSLVGSARVGSILTILVVTFLAFDAVMKVIAAAPAVAATGELGFSAAATQVLGLVLGVATLLYAAPATRVVGAITLTGYLGGAVAVQAQHGAPLGTHVLFGVYIGIMLWGAVWLQNPLLRQLLPFRRSHVA